MHIFENLLIFNDKTYYFNETDDVSWGHDTMLNKKSSTKLNKVTAETRIKQKREKAVVS